MILDFEFLEPGTQDDEAMPNPLVTHKLGHVDCSCIVLPTVCFHKPPAAAPATATVTAAAAAASAAAAALIILNLHEDK